MSAITLNNISQAVASAERHQDYATVMALSGRKADARKHARHARAILDEVMLLTRPEIEITDEELIEELGVAMYHEEILAGLKAPHSRTRLSNGVACRWTYNADGSMA